MFSRAWERLHVFLHLEPVACFPALGTGYMFSRAWERLHVFPRLEPVACFPALGNGCMFSCTWNRLPIVRCMALPPLLPYCVVQATFAMILFSAAVN